MTNYREASKITSKHPVTDAVMRRANLQREETPTIRNQFMHTHTNIGAQVVLGLAYTLSMCHVSGCLPSQQYTTHRKRKHTLMQPEGRLRAHTNQYADTHANFTHSDAIILWP